MDLNDFDLPFATENAVELSGGSRSKGYTGYALEKRKDRPSFRPEVAKVLENFAGSYHNEILYQKQIKKTKSELCL